ESKLGKNLLDFLTGKSKVEIFGNKTADPNQRIPIVSFRVAGKNSADIPPQLDPHKIAVRFGHFHAKRLMESLNINAADGVVRASIAHYNSEAEINRLIERLDPLLN
ncbi:MAG: aminotransferase class V-fold PLP-dependent enzyme, partial [Gammaproteobacteria bacterium]|nr:aminotransferase class V-fold PLP-dependent enzyme [Gammaproteobacteria bacterium]